jgi:hypothetical protein
MRALERYHPSDPSDIEEEYLCDYDIENLVQIGHITMEEGKKIKERAKQSKEEQKQKEKKAQKKPR